MNSFHDTIDCNQAQLNLFESKAKTQDKKVLEIFRTQNRSMTTREVHKIYLEIYETEIPFDFKTPLDSIKRSVTNLTSAKHLTKNPKEEQVLGKYNVPNNTWKLAA